MAGSSQTEATRGELMAETRIAPVEGSRVRFLDTEGNRIKGIAGLEGEVTKVQDYILHVKMDLSTAGSVLPSGRQYPTRSQVEVLS
jgi:hypothetical protein